MLPNLKNTYKEYPENRPYSPELQAMNAWLPLPFFISVLSEKEDIGIHRKLGAIVFNSKGVVEGTSHSLEIMTNYAIFVLLN